MNKTFFFCLFVISFASCSVTRYPAKSYLQDQTGYYDWGKKTDDSQRAKYYVIVGSYPLLDDAIKLKSKLELESYHPIILPLEEGRYRVSLGVYSFKVNAEAAQKEYRKKNSGVNPWILIK